MSASSTTRVEPEPPSFPPAASAAASADAGKPARDTAPAASPTPSPAEASQPALAAQAATGEQMSRLEDKLARIEEKLARSEAQILRLEDRVEHNTGVAGALATQDSVDRANARLRLLPGFPSLIVAAVLAGVIAAALTALVQRFGLTG